jgi:hypothetical protein
MFLYAVVAGCRRLRGWKESDASGAQVPQDRDPTLKKEAAKLVDYSGFPADPAVWDAVQGLKTS